MRKKIKIAFIYIFVVTGIFVLFKGIIYGWDTEYINMMPGLPLSTVVIENRRNKRD